MRAGLGCVTSASRHARLGPTRNSATTSSGATVAESPMRMSRKPEARCPGDQSSGLCFVPHLASGLWHLTSSAAPPTINSAPRLFSASACRFVRDEEAHAAQRAPRRLAEQEREALRGGHEDVRRLAALAGCSAGRVSPVRARCRPAQPARRAAAGDFRGRRRARTAGRKLHDTGGARRNHAPGQAHRRRRKTPRRLLPLPVGDEMSVSAREISGTAKLSRGQNWPKRRRNHAQLRVQRHDQLRFAEQRRCDAESVMDPQSLPPGLGEARAGEAAAGVERVDLAGGLVGADAPDAGKRRA